MKNKKIRSLWISSTLIASAAITPIIAISCETGLEKSKRLLNNLIENANNDIKSKNSNLTDSQKSEISAAITEAQKILNKKDSTKTEYDQARDTLNKKINDIKNSKNPDDFQNVEGLLIAKFAKNQKNTNPQDVIDELLKSKNLAEIKKVLEKYGIEANFDEASKEAEYKIGNGSHIHGHEGEIHFFIEKKIDTLTKKIGFTVKGFKNVEDGHHHHHKNEHDEENRDKKIEGYFESIGLKIAKWADNQSNTDPKIVSNEISKTKTLEELAQVLKKYNIDCDFSKKELEANYEWAQGSSWIANEGKLILIITKKSKGQRDSMGFLFAIHGFKKTKTQHGHNHNHHTPFKEQFNEQINLKIYNIAKDQQNIDPNIVVEELIKTKNLEEIEMVLKKYNVQTDFKNAEKEGSYKVLSSSHAHRSQGEIHITIEYKNGEVQKLGGFLIKGFKKESSILPKITKIGNWLYQTKTTKTGLKAEEVLNDIVEASKKKNFQALLETIKKYTDIKKDDETNMEDEFILEIEEQDNNGHKYIPYYTREIEGKQYVIFWLTYTYKKSEPEKRTKSEWSFILEIA